LQPVERLVDEVPLCASNVKPWIEMIWRGFMHDCPKPETHPEFRKLAETRAARASREEAPRVRHRATKPRRRNAQGKKTRSDSERGSGYARAAIKEMLTKYLIRMLRDEAPPSVSDK